MAFLDNSGDILLDAVLTDTGRMRLAQGNFNITYYGFGDDEINYGLYRNSNHSSGAHPSGSAYYDLDILQTPILEAFTDNAANLKSRLVTYTVLTHTHLPILKLNEETAAVQRNTDASQANKKFVVTVDEETSRAINDPGNTGQNKGLYKDNQGMMKGISPGIPTTFIRVDQGLDTATITPATALDPGLVETRYSIEMDARLGSIAAYPGATGAAVFAPLSFVDDDNIATYTVSQATDPLFVFRNPAKTLVGSGNETIRGPRGTMLFLKIKSSIELQDSNDLFEKIGLLNQSWVDTTGTATIHYIDTVVRVNGLTTGYRIDIPVRFVKLAAAR